MKNLFRIELKYYYLQAVIIAVWLTSSLLSFHKFYYAATVQHWVSEIDGDEIICTLVVTDFDVKLADTIAFFLLYLCPAVVMSVMYFRIAVHLRREEKQIPVLPQLSSNSSSVIVAVLPPGTGQSRRILVRAN